jgi:hypothetical protein
MNGGSRNPPHDIDELCRLTESIAHDFNNLLTVVLMNLDAMRNDPVVVEKFGRRIELMSDASHQGVGLVRQLLVHAGKEPPEAEVLEIQVSE